MSGPAFQAAAAPSTATRLARSQRCSARCPVPCGARWPAQPAASPSLPPAPCPPPRRRLLSRCTCVCLCAAREADIAARGRVRLRRVWPVGDRGGRPVLPFSTFDTPAGGALCSASQAASGARCAASLYVRAAPPQLDVFVLVPTARARSGGLTPVALRRRHRTAGSRRRYWLAILMGISRAAHSSESHEIKACGASSHGWRDSTERRPARAATRSPKQ